MLQNRTISHRLEDCRTGGDSLGRLMRLLLPARQRGLGLQKAPAQQRHLHCIYIYICIGTCACVIGITVHAYRYMCMQVDMLAFVRVYIYRYVYVYVRVWVFWNIVFWSLIPKATTDKGHVWGAVEFLKRLSERRSDQLF